MNKFALNIFILALACTRVISNEKREVTSIEAALRDKCHKESGVDLEHVEITKEGIFVDNEKLGCYFSCLFKIFKLLDSTGHLDYDHILQKFEDAETYRDHGVEMIKSCRDIKGENPCQTILQVVQCFQKTAPEHFIVI